MNKAQSAEHIAPRLLRNMAFLKLHKNMSFQMALRVSKNVSPVNPVLNRVAQDMELCQQPCRQHGQSVGADKERDHQQPHAVADGIHKEDEQTEETENGGGDAEDITSV